MGFEGVELLRAYAGDLLELVDGGEGAVLGAVVEDALGQDRADAGKGIELVEGGCVEVDGCGGGGCGRVGRAWWGGRRAGWGGLADEDLFAVGDLAGEVEGGEVDAWERAAGEGEDIGHAGAGGRADQAGAAYFAGDVDDDGARCLAWDARR
jgi:hypothetical protein